MLDENNVLSLNPLFDSNFFPLSKLILLSPVVILDLLVILNPDNAIGLIAMVQLEPIPYLMLFGAIIRTIP